MRYHHLIKQRLENHQKRQKRKGKNNKLDWWQLSLIGIGSIIGAGFFLGTGLSIQLAGPSILIAYLIGGITAFLVFSALAEMTVNDQDLGSFRLYAKKAFGHSLGFISGWMYWVAGILIMSSEVTALSIFTQFWFKGVPLWIFAILYSALGFGINFLGVKNFGNIESFFAVIKISVLMIFIIFGLLLIIGIITPQATYDGTFVQLQKTKGLMFPNGFIGMWRAMIFVLFSFGGIAVVGILANELKNKNDVPKVGTMMIILLTSIYLLAIFVVLYIVNWSNINEKESPFVTTLSSFQIPYLDSVFNIIIISAAFSTMVGALYSITRVLVSLANDHDAPNSFSKLNRRGVASRALGLNGIALASTIILSFVLPNKVYEYLTTAAGVMLILNWVIIFASQLKNRKRYEGNKFKMFGYPYTSYLGIALILFTIIGSLFKVEQRIGLFISLGIIGLLFLIYYLIFSRQHKVDE